MTLLAMPATIRALFDRLLLAIAPPRCASCSASLAADAVFCAACVASLEPPPKLSHGVTASFAYGGALAEAIRLHKYGGRVDLARPLARLVVEGLPQAEEIDVVAPAPLHATRLRARGFDQAALLARAVARAIERPLAIDLLARTRPTPQLAGLDYGARQRAVWGVFRAKKEAQGRCVLLVDDVRTTGATLGAAARALEAIGARSLAHVLAATPSQ